MYNKPDEISSIRHSTLEEPRRDDVVCEGDNIMVVPRRIGVWEQDSEH